MKIARSLFLTSFLAINFGCFSYALDNASNLDVGTKVDTSVPDTEVRDEKINTSNDYDANYYEDEGRLIFRAKLSGIISRGVQHKFSSDYTRSPAGKISDLIKNGYGGEVSATIFFHNNFAADLSLGFNSYRVNSDSIKDIGSNYFKSYGYVDYTDKNNPKYVKIDTPSYEKTRNINAIPVTALFQFHIAPFGGIRPYVGVGGAYNYLFTPSKEFDVKPALGFVGQVGVDFVARDDTFISLDIKMSSLSTKIKYKPSVTGYNGSTNNPRYIENLVKLNPIVFSVGVSYKF